MRKIKLVEVRSEIAAGTRGASMGIDALKIASLDKKSGFFTQFDPINVPDANSFLWKGNKHPHAKYIDGVYQVLKNVYSTIESLRLEKKFPIVLAGDHSTAAGTIMGIKAANPEKRLGVIWIDAHADLHSPYTTPSGNMHGMPLVMATAEDNIDCKTNVPDEKTIGFWNKLKALGGAGPKIQFEDIVFIAVRDVEPQENYLIQKHKVKNFTVTDVRKRGVEKVAFEALSTLDKCDIIYISFDVDSMDPKVSMGTGTPVPNGINEREAGKLLQNLVSSPKVVCFEMVEVNPTLDKENIMAETAFEILVKVTNSISNQSIL